MRKKLILLVSILLLGSSFVFSDAISFKFVYFAPRANSDLWDEEFRLMDFTKSSFHNTSISFSYEYFLRREISFLISIDAYSRKKVGVYEGLVGEEFSDGDWAFDYGTGFSVQHTFDVSITPIQLSVKFTPMGRRERFIPYIGAGVGIYLWTARLLGDWIVFSEGALFYDSNLDEDVMGYPIYFADVRDENKISFGYHAFGGVMIPVSNRLSLDLEFKYNIAQGDLKHFEGFESFDLNSYLFSLGISYWF
jgi:opacity protein-like surface antigen